MQTESFDLAHMKIQEPAPVSYSFDTLGWKLLAFTAILVMLFVLYRAVSNYRRNKYRREAIKLLNTADSLNQGLVILKKVAMRVYGREQVAALYGTPYWVFLDDKLSVPIWKDKIHELNQAVYGSSEMKLEFVKPLMIKWIKQHGTK
ncbi:MAG: DUF4381 domain-containing protein [Flavobacteriaceae bacterium]